MKKPTIGKTQRSYQRKKKEKKTAPPPPPPDDPRPPGGAAKAKAKAKTIKDTGMLKKPAQKAKMPEVVVDTGARSSNSKPVLPIATVPVSVPSRKRKASAPEEERRGKKRRVMTQRFALA